MAIDVNQVSDKQVLEMLAYKEGHFLDSVLSAIISQSVLIDSRWIVLVCPRRNTKSKQIGVEVQ